MGPIDLVVFDLAGTTIDDSGGAVLRYLMETARQYELPGSDAELNALMGMNKREVFDLLACSIPSLICPRSSVRPRAEMEIRSRTGMPAARMTGG